MLAYWLCKWRRAFALSQRRKTWRAARWTPPGEDTVPAWCPAFARLRTKNGFTPWANRLPKRKSIWCMMCDRVNIYLLDSAPDEGLEFGVLFLSRSRASCSMFSDLQHVRQTFFNTINQMAHLRSRTYDEILNANLAAVGRWINRCGVHLLLRTGFSYKLYKAAFCHGKFFSQPGSLDQKRTERNDQQSKHWGLCCLHFALMKFRPQVT